MEIECKNEKSRTRIYPYVKRQTSKGSGKKHSVNVILLQRIKYSIKILFHFYFPNRLVISYCSVLFLSSH